MKGAPEIMNLFESCNGIGFIRTDKNRKVYVYEAKLKASSERISPRCYLKSQVKIYMKRRRLKNADRW